MPVMGEKASSLHAAAATSKFVLNLLPITFSVPEVIGGTLTYESKEQLADIKSRLRGTHVILREGGTKIVSVPVVAGAPTIGDKTQITLAAASHVASRLVENALIKHFTDLKREVLDDDPITLVSKNVEDNLIAMSAGEVPAWLAINVIYELQARTIAFDRITKSLMLATNVRSRQRVLWPCSKLSERGLNLIGLYVGERFPRRDPRVTPIVRLTGRVRAVENGVLVLDDRRPDAAETLAVELAYPDAGAETFRRCLRVLYGGKATEIESRLRRVRADVLGGPERLRRVRAITKYLLEHPLEVVPGCTATFGAMLEQATTPSFPTIERAPGPVYVFDPMGRSVSESNNKGLDLYGPYSRTTHTPSRPRVCVVCQATRKGGVEQFVNKLLNGVPSSGSWWNPFPKGLTRQYGLDHVDVEFFVTKDRTAEGYRKAALEAIAASTRIGKNWDLALVQVERSFDQLPDRESPYLVTKATFLSLQIPTQEFRIETAEIPDHRIGYALSNMALATYSKLNGIGWLLKSEPTIAHELVIGLGSTNLGEGRLGGRTRMVGITTVFTGDGRYHLWNLSKAVPMEEYRETVLSNLRDVIDQMKRDMAWRSKAQIRVIFHAFKPFRNMEAEAVEALLKELTDYTVECAFVNVIDDHPFLMCDESQPGLPKGKFAPMRGSYLHLSDEEVLIQFTGAKELKRAEDGLPRPLLLKLHRNSTFRDMTYLARQAFVFSGHSWRAFLPAPQPVTILYSDLIANLLGRLGKLPSWDPGVMLGKIGTTRWFL